MQPMQLCISPEKLFENTWENTLKINPANTIECYLPRKQIKETSTSISTSTSTACSLRHDPPPSMICVANAGEHAYGRVRSMDVPSHPPWWNCCMIIRQYTIPLVLEHCCLLIRQYTILVLVQCCLLIREYTILVLVHCCLLTQGAEIALLPAPQIAQGTKIYHINFSLHAGTIILIST